MRRRTVTTAAIVSILIGVLLLVLAGWLRQQGQRTVEQCEAQGRVVIDSEGSRWCVDGRGLVSA